MGKGKKKHKILLKDNEIKMSGQLYHISNEEFTIRKMSVFPEGYSLHLRERFKNKIKWTRRQVYVSIW